MRIFVLPAILALFLLTAVTAGAAPPTQLRVQLEDTYLSSYTDVCGFNVFTTFSERMDVKFFQTKDGVTVRETDTFPGSKATFWTDVSDKSFTVMFDYTAITRYPEGTSVGDPAIVKVVGLWQDAPGVPANAGMQVISGVIYGSMDVDGTAIPLVNYVDLLMSHGYQSDAVPQAVCAALAP